MPLQEQPPEEPRGPPERIDSVRVLGANVMAGTHPPEQAQERHAVEVRLWNTSPVNPRTAAEEMDRRLVQKMMRDGGGA